MHFAKFIQFKVELVNSDIIFFSELNAVTDEIISP